MIRKFVVISFIVYLFNIAGCSFPSLKYSSRETHIGVNNTYLILIDPNNGFLEITEKNKHITINTKPIIDLKKSCKIKYSSLPEFQNIVKGRRGEGYHCDIAIV